MWHSGGGLLGGRWVTSLGGAGLCDREVRGVDPSMCVVVIHVCCVLCANYDAEKLM